jgi:predicted nucleic acid-binding protein
MIIVSDTSPINYLVLIGEIEILRKLAGQVIIPQAVYRELQDPHTPQQVKDWIDSGPAWIEVRQAKMKWLYDLSALTQSTLQISPHLALAM